MRVLLLFILIPALLQAQSDAIPREALDLFQKAQKAMEGGNGQFAKAEELLLRAIALAPDHAELNAAMGTLQLNGPYRDQALPYFAKACEAAPQLPRIHFLHGYALHLNSRWDEAIAAYRQHKKAAPYKDEDAFYNSADKRIIECTHGKEFGTSPSHALVKNMGEFINSPQADHGALITADGADLFFTSRRSSGSEAKESRGKECFDDILHCQWSRNAWGPTIPLPAPVNTPRNDASVGLFNDGRTLLVYRDVHGAGDLYETKRTGQKWAEPTSLGPEVNSAFHESSAWFSFDRQWLYFVSDRPTDNLGGQDIYRSRWNAIAKQWGPAENLGGAINTVHDEEGVFVHPDGKTIYFSSKGHSTVGGYDVFRSAFVDGAWTQPANLGIPVNSPDDDLFFVLTANGSTGYLNSPRAGGMGEDDLYEVTFMPDPPKRDGALLASTSGSAPLTADDLPSTILLKGRIKQLKMLRGLEATIELMDLEDASLVARFTSDAVTGEYLIALPGGRRYAIYVKADGFLMHAGTVEIPDGELNLTVDLDVDLAPLEAGHSTTMRNLFFASGSAALEESSNADIDQIEQLLASNDTLRLEISGHTDNSGPAELNERLSHARANAVRDRLLQRGVAQERLLAVGFGDSRPVAPNGSEANKALNRRTEIKVL